MRKSRAVCALAGMAIVALAFAAPAWADPDGAALYAKHCASCHGADARGATPAGKALQVKDLATARWASPEALAQIEKSIREGVPRMPPLASKLSAEEIAAVARRTQEMAAAAAKP